MTASSKLPLLAIFVCVLLTGCGGGAAAPATPAATAPVAVDDAVQTLEDTAATFALVTNDTDVNGDTLTVTLVGTPSHGTASIVVGGVLYTPDADYEGTDSFSYTVSDGGLTDSGTVTVTVTRRDRLMLSFTEGGVRHSYLLSTTTPGVTGVQLTPNALPRTTSPSTCGLAFAGNVGAVAEGFSYVSSADGDLYYVALDAPGVATKLADDVLSSSSSLSCTTDLERTKVYWLAQEAGGQISLKVAPWGDPAGAVTLKGPWTPLSVNVGGLLRAPGASPTHLMLWGDADVTGTYEVWSVRISDGLVTQLNPAFGAGSSLAASSSTLPRFSPAGDQVYYVADQDTNDKFEAYRVALSNPGVTTKVNSALPASGDVTRMSVSTTTGFIALLADQATDEEFHAFAVSPTNLGTMTDVTPALVAGGDAVPFITASFGQMMFLADATTDGINDLYHVNLNNGFATAQRVNPALVAGGAVLVGQIYSIDATRILYYAAQDTAGVFELYSAVLGVYGASIKLNDPLPGGDSVSDFNFVNADTVYYTADQDGDGFQEVWLVAIDGATAPVQLSDELSGTATLPSVSVFP